MGKKSKKEYIEVLRRRYRKTKGKKEKGRIINELVVNCRFNRKYAIRVLNKNGEVDLRRKKGPGRKRKPRYSTKVMQLIKMIWESADYPCGPILKKVIPLWLPYLIDDYCIDKKTQAGMLAMGSAQIDRRLRKDKKSKKKKIYGTTKPGKLLKYQIEISTGQWDVNKPGYVEMDTVAHCGNNLSGEFAYTVNNTDIHTCWVERRAILGKGQQRTVKAVEETDDAFPFKMVARDCDNGGEFLNYHMVDYCRAKGLKLTRSRSYHKNDNAYVEQKNWTHVRKMFGYQRIETQKQVELMNDLYKNELRLFQNFFSPNRKLIMKKRKGTRTIKKYDEPQTPYERVLNSKHTSKKDKEKLKEIFKGLNPVQLRIRIDKKIAKVLGYKSK